MWTHIVKFDNKLYQDGKEIKEISYFGNIVDMVVKENSVWFKVKK